MMFEHVLYHLEFNHDQLCIVLLSGLELNIFQMFGILGSRYSSGQSAWMAIVTWELRLIQHGCDSTSARTSKILPIWYNQTTSKQGNHITSLISLGLALIFGHISYFIFLLYFFWLPTANVICSSEMAGPRSGPHCRSQ